MTAQTLIRRYMILGERRWSNYVWAIALSLGSLGFLGAGVASYFHLSSLLFFPQGLLMSFYGSLGLLVSVYWWLLIFWNVGAGFNEVNKKDGCVRIFRWGYPGKNRRIDFSYPLKDIQSIRVELKQGWDPQRTIYLKIKGKPDIPLTGVTQPLTLKEIEKQASELANFLQVSLEGLSYA
jgi:hypothetical protein